MASVTAASDQGLTDYYKNALKNLSNELRSENERHEKQRQEDVDRLEKSYLLDLRRKDEDTEKLSQNLRDHAAQDLENQKKKYQAALDEMSQKNYSKSGLGAVLDAKKNYTKAIDDLEEQLQFEEQRHRQLEQDHEKQAQASLSRFSAQKEEDTEKTLKTFKEGSDATLERHSALHRDELGQLRKQLEDNTGKNSNTIPENVHRYQIQNLNDTVKREKQESTKNLEALKEDYTRHLSELERQQQNRLESLAQSHSQKKESRELRMQEENAYRMDEQKKKQDAYLNFLDEQREQQNTSAKALENDYHRQLDHDKAVLEKREHHLIQKNDEALREKEKNFSNNIQRQHEDHAQQMKNLQQTMEIQATDLKRQAVEDKKRTDASLNAFREKMNEDRENLIEHQSTAFREHAAQTEANHRFEKEELQKELSRYQNAKSIATVSPAAEDSMRKTLVQSYEKALNTEIQHHKERTEATQQKFARLQREGVEDFQKQQIASSRQHALDRAYEKTEFLGALEDTNYNAKTRITATQNESNRELDQARRNFENFIAHQRRDYEFMLENERATSAQRLNEVRTKASMELKDMHRELGTRQSELVRSYDQKLEIQRNELEAKIDELKSDAILSQRVLERKSKQDLEVQAKGYEHRIVQMASQNQERERRILQNSEEQLERLRRGYELSKKKG